MRISSAKQISYRQVYHPFPKGTDIIVKSLICLHDKSGFLHGGPEETRTLDLSDANRTLSQLSYRPISYPFELPEYYNAEKGESQGKRFLTEKKQAAFLGLPAKKFRKRTGTRRMRRKSQEEQCLASDAAFWLRERARTEGA